MEETSIDILGTYISKMTPESSWISLELRQWVLYMDLVSEGESNPGVGLL